MKIIFAGAGEFGLPTLRALRSGGFDVALVISQPDRPAGRGRGMTPTPIAAAALSAGLPLLRTADVNREAFNASASASVTAPASLPPADAMVVIAFGQKISEPVARWPRWGSVNLHASLLPRYRGAAPINWAILRGETETGNSIIRLAPRMDAGAILAQSKTPIGGLETAGELHDRLAIAGADLVVATLRDLAAGTAVEVEQNPAQATLAPKLTRASAVLDFSRPPGELARQIRGLFPWPGCRVNLCDATGAALASVRLVRARARPSDEASRWNPGEIMSDGAVAAGPGAAAEALEVVEVQPDGGRPMPLPDYRRGRRWSAGMRLVSAD